MESVDVQSVSECPNGDELCVVRAFESEVIIVPALLVAISCIVAGCIFWMACRHKRGRKLAGLADALPGAGTSLDLAPRGSARSDPCLDHWQISRERIVGGLKWIARGRYGNVYQARLAPAQPGKERTVVVKELQASAAPSLAEEFLARIRFQAVLGQHPHLVDMVGCCTEQGPLCLLMESLDLGSLLNFLWLCRKDVVTMASTPYDLTERQVYDIALQVASALEFLHTKGLIHGDAAARNVLLGADLTAKLAGLHIPFSIQTNGLVSPHNAGPQKWQSPETLMKRPLSSKTDVWSFGILLYEMISLGAPPYGDLAPTAVLQYLQRGHRITQPATCRTSLYRLMRQCWQWRRELRPDLTELRKRLQVGQRSADDSVVLRVPHRIEPEAYAVVAGTSCDWGQEYTVL